MRYFLLVFVVLIGCGGWPKVEPAPRNDLTSEQSEAYRALAHQLSNYMNARTSDLEVNLELAAILEEVLLHVRAFEDEDWRRARTNFEQVFSAAKVPDKTIVTVMLDRDAPYLSRWGAGEQWSGEPVLDDLISKYDIKVQPRGILVNDFFDLIVPREVNRYALENLVAKASGIGFPIPDLDLYAWGNGLHLGDSVLVRPDKRLCGWKLWIFVGWGDCPAGCINGRKYSFEIDTSGETRLAKVTGDPWEAM